MPFFEELFKEYMQGHRYYHNSNHIFDCLDILYDTRAFALNPNAVEFAIWYHDFVYDPKSKTNEEDSAKKAEEVCNNASLPKEFTQRVIDLVLATKHKSAPRNLDEQLITDIDLTILGSAEEKFRKYEEGIRKEYSHLSDIEFAKERFSVIDSFLKRPNIYSFDLFRRKYQDQARTNLNKSLVNLLWL